jgi:NADH-quinone oxidoreductase E subunit
MEAEKVDTMKVDEIVDRYGCDRSGLIGILQEVQNEYNWLPRETLSRVAEKLDLPLVEVFGAVTFYRAFSLKPRGKHMVTVCVGTACHVRGAPRVLAQLEKRLGVSPGETTEDKQFTLETVNCLGACALGPVVVVDDEYHGHMTAKKVEPLIGDVHQRDRLQEGSRGS